jgi:oxygen-independent coproporphyrinogen-3 oxidase
VIREFVLQLKRGALKPAYFAEKYGVDVLERFAGPLASLHDQGWLEQVGPDQVSVSPQGLLRVDALLHRFFLPEHADVRYT